MDIRVHDSNANMRHLVLPMRPAGTGGWTEQQLAGIVTRDTMIGVAIPAAESMQASASGGRRLACATRGSGLGQEYSRCA